MLCVVHCALFQIYNTPILAPPPHPRTQVVSCEDVKCKQIVKNSATKLCVIMVFETFLAFVRDDRILDDLKEMGEHELAVTVEAHSVQPIPGKESPFIQWNYL